MDNNVFYTNSIGIEMTNLDIKMKVDYTSKGKVIHFCDVVFSPEQAKLTAIILNKAVEEFEKRNRKINIDSASTIDFKQSEGERKNGGEGK